MLLIKSSNLLHEYFSEQVIVFDPNTGQTHCLDNNVIEILGQMSTNKSNSLAQLKQFFTQECSNDEKTRINDYIQDMINNLLQLKLIRVHSL